MSERGKEAAKNRWNLLKLVITNKTLPNPETLEGSKRRFSKYHKLIDWYVEEENSYIVSIASAPEGKKDFKVIVCRPDKNRSQHIDTNCLSGSDRTGQLCIWPSEQVLAYWVCSHLDLFHNCHVIELGGGFHSLAGLLIARFGSARSVTLTDGEDSNILCMQWSLKANEIPDQLGKACKVEWRKDCTKEERSFDAVIAADVLYPTIDFTSLVHTIAHLLKPEGKLIIFNPRRGEVLKKVAKELENSGFFNSISLDTEYDSYVSSCVQELKESCPAFNEEWHFPIKLTAVKEPKSTFYLN